MENFWFSVFDNKIELVEEKDNNVVATKQWSIWFLKRIFLRNKKSIIYKTKKWNRISGIRFLTLSFKNMKYKWNIKSRKNKEKSRLLFYTYSYVKKLGNKIAL